MNYIFKISVIVLFLSLFLGCVTGPQSKGKEAEDMVSKYSSMPKYAKGFQIIKTDDAKIIRIFNPWDSERILQEIYLYQSDNQSYNKSIHSNSLVVPVKNIAVSSLDNIGFLDLLSALDLVVAITDVDRVYNAKIQRKIAEGSIQYLGPAVDLNVEKLVVSHPDLLFSTTFNVGSKKSDIYEKSGILTFFNMDWMEQSPLGRAEWIKVVGAFLNKEAQADSIFSAIEHNYQTIKEKSQLSTSRPEVIIGSNYKGIWYMPGGRSFKAQLLADAGASYHWSIDSSKGSLALSFEKVVELQSKAEIWLEAPFKSYDEIEAVDARYGIFKAYKDSMVFNNLGLSHGAANDYWERGLCRPDLILMDLVEIFHPNLFDHKLLFYKKI